MTKEEALEKAKLHAPIFAHKVDREWILADQIAPVDFAGGGLMNCAANIDRLFGLPHDDRDITKPKIYFSLCETTTHYFIFYAVYHVFDWWKRKGARDLYNLIRDSLDEHVHDMEGALFVISKKSKRRPEWIDGVVTMAHRNFYLYTEQYFPPPKRGKDPVPRGQSLYISKFNETVDGKIWLDPQSRRVKLYIQAKGHGMYGSNEHWGGGQEIWYYAPKGQTTDPRPTKMKKFEDVADPKRFRKNEIAVLRHYELEDIFAPDGLWAHQDNADVFKQHKNGAWGFVYRDKKDGELKPGAANPPWSFNDRNDLSPLGEIGTDPAHFILRYGQGWGPVSTHYLYNPYLGIE